MSGTICASTAEEKEAVKDMMVMMESPQLVRQIESPGCTRLFGIELAQNMRAMWKFRREDYENHEDSVTPWVVLAANSVLESARQLSIHGQARMKTANGAVVFTAIEGDVYMRGPDSSYVCKVYMALFHSITVSLANLLAPFQKREQDI